MRLFLCSGLSSVIGACASAIALALALPCHAQEAPIAASVLNATNAHIGAAPASTGATIFSGDLLRTESDGGIQLQAGRTQFVLLPDSSFRLFRSGSKLIVELERGALNYAAAATDESVTIYASDIRIVPVPSQLSSGQVAIVSRCEVRVASDRGSMNLISAKQNTLLQQGQATRVFSEFGIDYRDSWKPIPADYPDFDPHSEYHKSHSHSACPAPPSQSNKAPLPPGHPNMKALYLIIPAVLCLEICPHFESGEKPR